MHATNTELDRLHLVQMTDKQMDKQTDGRVTGSVCNEVNLLVMQWVCIIPTYVFAERVLGRLCCQLGMSWLTRIFPWGPISEGVEARTLDGGAKSALASAVSMTAMGTLAGRGKGLLPLGGSCHMGALPHNAQLLEHQLPKVEGDIACSSTVDMSLLGDIIVLKSKMKCP